MYISKIHITQHTFYFRSTRISDLYSTLNRIQPQKPGHTIFARKKDKFLANRKQLLRWNLGRTKIAINGPIPFPTTVICLTLVTSVGNVFREVCLGFLL